MVSDMVVVIIVIDLFRPAMDSTRLVKAPYYDPISPLVLTSIGREAIDKGQCLAL